MANSYKTLVETQLPSGAATIGTVPALTSWLVKDISLVNTNTTGAVTVSLYRNGTTGTKLITPPNVSIVAGGMYAFSGGTLTWEAGGTIAGVASISGTVTVCISGDEVS